MSTKQCEKKISTRKGGAKKQGPKHKNTFAFAHNKASKKSKKIAVLPNVGLCKKCYEIIEWRKKYRKYKPLTQPRKCNLCEQKTVKAAYHILCDPCADKLDVCAKCMNSEVFQSDKELEELHRKEMRELEKTLETVPVRVRKTIKRKLRNGELDNSEDEEEGEEEEDEEEEEEEDEDEEEEEVEKENVDKKEAKKVEAEVENEEEDEEEGDLESFDEDEEFDDDLDAELLDQIKKL